MPASRSFDRATAWLILAAASWGLGTVISKRAVEEIPPLSLLAVQLSASLVALAILLRWRGMPLRDPTAPPLLGRLGLLNPGLAYALGLVGLAQISASLSVVLWAAEPLLIVLLAGLVLGERVRRSLVVLSGVAVAGLGLVTYEPGIGGSGAGIALTLAGVACCAVYAVVARRWIGATDGTAPVVVSQQWHALAVALPVALAIEAVAGWPTARGGVSMLGWLTAASSGVLYYGAAYWCYLAALRRLPASSAAASFYLVPIFGLAGGAALLGEQLTAVQWAGAIVVVTAVALSLRGGAARSPRPEPSSAATAAPSPPR